MRRGTYADKLVSDISNYGTNCFVEGRLGGATEDAWTMNHRKEIINVKNSAF